MQLSTRYPMFRTEKLSVYYPSVRVNRRNSLSDRTNWKLILLLDRLEDRLEDQSNLAHHYFNRLYKLANQKNSEEFCGCTKRVVGYD
jgi:hypothetical protein